VRVVSWNLGYWTPATFKGVENRRRQWDYLLDLEPTIALLQECRPEDLENLTAERGANYRAVGGIPSGWTACSTIVVPRDLNVTPIPPDTLWMEYLSGYVARAELPGLLRGLPLQVACVHASAKVVTDRVLSEADHAVLKRPGCDLAWHCDLVAAALHRWSGPEFIIAGDWNTARLFDTTYPGRWPDAGKDFFALLASWGWDETARRHHSDEIATFRSQNDGPKLGEYQLDHMFTGPSLAGRLTAFDVHTDVFTDALSDHAPIVADFS
jgi:endonuclease/exonuclease/phosphatase family metal-dependent hydrolase